MEDEEAVRDRVNQIESYISTEISIVFRQVMSLENCMRQILGFQLTTCIGIMYRMWVLSPN